MKKLLLSLGAVAAVAAPVAAVVACGTGSFDGGEMTLTVASNSNKNLGDFKTAVTASKNITDTTALATALGIDATVFGTNDAGTTETIKSISFDESSKVLTVSTEKTGDVSMKLHYKITITLATA